MTTDFQIAPVEPAPTPQTTPAAPQTPGPAPTPTPAPQAQLDHTPGGLPVIPLAVITGNTTIAGLSALAVTAGPAAAAAAAGGLLVSAAAVRVSGRRGTRKAARRPAPRPVPKKPTPVTRHASSGGGNRTPITPKQRTTSNGGTGGRRSTGMGSTALKTGRGTTTRHTASSGTAGTSGKGTGTALRKTPANRTPKSGRGTTPKTSPNTHSASSNRKPTGSRASQIKALRKDKAATAPTRRERRTKDLADRRNLRDATRLNKRAARRDKNTAPHTPGALNTPKTAARRTTGPVSAATKTKRAVTAPIDAKNTGKAADTLRPTRTDKLRAKARTVRDQATQTRAARIQKARNKAKARAKLTKTQAGARARYGFKAAGLGLLTAPVGLLGCLTTPLGKKLGWSWLQYPGRRLYRRLTATARYNRDARLADAANTYAHDTNPASLDTTDPAHAQPIGDTVARAPRTGNTPNLTGEPDMSEDIKLHFLDASADTVSAAQAYEPGGMLHVRQVIKAMPVALENWAMAFGVLAEKSDAEFPLGDEIGEGLDDIHQQMRQLISRAEDLAQTFDRIHEHDIERLTNPRKSAEAEKTWDTTANEDYDVD